MSMLPRGTVTLLFTDIEGSTELLRTLGRDRYVQALGDHRRILREAFTRHGGIEVEMQGDASSSRSRTPSTRSPRPRKRNAI
jgi:class 3 adenylate cyclase